MPNLYLGGIRDAIDEKFLKDNKITHILSVIDRDVPRYPHIIGYKHIKIHDFPICQLSPYFDETSEFIDQSLVGDNRILVHCRMGVSRSASVVIAYLMKKYNMSYDEAFQFVK